MCGGGGLKVKAGFDNHKFLIVSPLAESMGFAVQASDFPDFNARDHLGMTPLHRAAQKFVVTVQDMVGGGWRIF